MRPILSVLILGITLSVQGCAGVGLTMLGVGGGTAASVGVNHTLSGISYKTFTATKPDVERATFTALNQMGIKVNGNEVTEEGIHRITATANERKVVVELEALTIRTIRR